MSIDVRRPLAVDLFAGAGGLSLGLEQAGYGVDPNLTFDFGVVDRAPRTGLMPPAAFVMQSSYLCDDPVNCRDRADGSDELVFIARSPWFRRITDGVTTSSMRV